MAEGDGDLRLYPGRLAVLQFPNNAHQAVVQVEVSEGDAGSRDIVPGHTHAHCLAQRRHLRGGERGKCIVLLVEITTKTGVVNLRGREGGREGGGRKEGREGGREGDCTNVW